MAPDAIPALLEQIDELLAEPSPREEPATLARLERRMSELAGELDEGNQELKAKELALLSQRLSSNSSTLTGLRGTLLRLRAHATAVRSRA